MEMILYKVDDADNVINKVKNDGVSFQINLRNDIDLSSPVLMLSNVDGVDYFDYNYIHIPALKRFYFIDDIESVNNSLWRLFLSCDVLETYKNDLLNSLSRFRRGIKTGDYINASIDYTIYKSVKKYDSDVTISDNASSKILTTVGV